MRDFMELLSIHADDIITTIVGIILLIAVVGGMLIAVHIDLQNGCHSTNQVLSSYYGMCEIPK